MATKETPVEGTVRPVLAFLAPHEYSAISLANPSFSIVSRRRTGPSFSNMVWLRYQMKVAGGLELAEQDRLKLEPTLMYWEGFEGVTLTSSGPSEVQQHMERG